ncbi:hypothetical protein RHMOL_Rhmol03G0128500 [Rhododendron molle]|uniref:Uncharacterized protein n=1 Tax=Rhododendron molle TaxID=49168 RepID=A0ACC0PE25_RHOML|nr:hypothetical protein RHMOL_Rhmol03G0128500 [Rhododendron molle]
MENPLPTLLRPWLVQFLSIDWLNFKYYGLASFRYLLHVPFCPELLRAVLRFWDPDVHVFRFGDDEICLTVEEFQAYLRTFASPTIVVPPYQVSILGLLATSLNISRGLANTILEGGQINIMRLIERYNPDGDLEDATLFIWLLTCLFAHAVVVIKQIGLAATASAWLEFLSEEDSLEGDEIP